MIVALGMAVVVATGGIDLSVGAVMALAAATLAAPLDHGAWIAMAVAFGAGSLAGVFNGLLVGVVRCNRSSPPSGCSSPAGAWR